MLNMYEFIYSVCSLEADPKAPVVTVMQLAEHFKSTGLKVLSDDAAVFPYLLLQPLSRRCKSSKATLSLLLLHRATSRCALCLFVCLSIFCEEKGETYNC